MKKIFKSLLTLAAITCLAPAAHAEEPIVTFRTSIYETYGETNQFTLLLGGTAGEYVYVDCGFGEVEVELQEGYLDTEVGEMAGVSVPCQVSSEGIVKVYGDPGVIDYFDAEGCYIREIDLSGLSDLSILDLSHNELESLDLSACSKLQVLTLSDNPFNVSPLIIGPDKPLLTILEMNIVGQLDQSFNLSDYPSLASFEAYHCDGLRNVDPTGCPELLRLSIDVTPVETLDVSKNENLIILNISDTKITSIDTSNCPNLTEFYCSHDGQLYSAYKISSLDLRNNTYLQRFFASNNNLSSLDLSNNTMLINLSLKRNNLTTLDLSANEALYSVDLSLNNFTFATLPLPSDLWGEYYYSQNLLSVDRSYPVGTELDFSSQVLREDTETTATLFGVNKYNPEIPYEMSELDYRYADGKVTLLTETTDSVFVRFENSAFPDYPLETSRFMVKSTADFGKAGTAISFLTDAAPKAIALSVGIDGATEASPKKFYVDFGDGKYQEFYASTSATPEAANVEGEIAGSGKVSVIVDEGVDLTAFAISGRPLYSLDVTAAAMLRELTVVDAGLYTLDLQWNRCLTSLKLNGNNLSSFSLEGSSYSYSKNVLSHIDLAGNNIKDLVLNERVAIQYLDLSDNNLESVDLSNGTNIAWCDLSGNNMTAFNLSYLESMTYFNGSGNHVSEIVMPETCVLTHFDISDNDMTIASLPYAPEIDDYVYTPQAVYLIPTKGPGVDLSSQVREINGYSTVFTWKNESGTELVEGTDYTNKNGIISFLDPNLGVVYCDMTHHEFPALTGEQALRTTSILVVDKPTEIIASFGIAESGTAEVILTATTPGSAVYIDWKGDGELYESCQLGTSYRSFSHQVEAGDEVKIYTYEGDQLTVFSIRGVKMTQVNGSNMSKLTMFSVSGAGLDLADIALPLNSDLSELVLADNEITEFDPSIFPNLYSLNLSGNNLTNLDISSLKGLGLLAASDNALEQVVLDNPNLWDLSLSGNNLSEIDLSKTPSMYQMSLISNRLSALDVSMLSQLRVMFLDDNRFVFTTLPAVSPAYTLYTYGNQANYQASVEDGSIDMSDQLSAAGQATTYTWFYDTPLIEDDALVGEELVENEDYVIENGVTRFLVDIDKAVCVMTNPAFPKLYLFTDVLSVTAGVENVMIDGFNGDVRYFDLRGIEVKNPDKGVYIIVRGNTVSKEVVR